MLHLVRLLIFRVWICSYILFSKMESSENPRNVNLFQTCLNRTKWWFFYIYSLLIIKVRKMRIFNLRKSQWNERFNVLIWNHINCWIVTCDFLTVIVELNLYDIENTSFKQFLVHIIFYKNMWIFWILNKIAFLKSTKQKKGLFKMFWMSFIMLLKYNHRI